MLLVAAVTVVPLATLLWLGWRLIAQDRALETQQIAQRLERAADLAVTGLQRAISESTQDLFGGSGPWPEGVVAVTRRGEQLEVLPPGRVAYLPVVPPLDEAPASTFARGDTLEFRQQAYEAAHAEFRRLSMSADRPTRAGALLRLGRSLRRQGRTDEALAVYARMKELDDVAIEGVPAGLVARYARCRVFDEDERREELRSEAREIRSALDAGVWRLTGPVYALYAADAAKWSGDANHLVEKGRRQQPSSAEVLAEAVEALWKRWQSMDPNAPRTSGADSLEIHGQTVTATWQWSDEGLRALVATTGFVQAQWLRAIAPIEAEQQIAVELRRPDGRPILGAGGSTAASAILRTSGDTALPWNIAVTSVDPPPEHREFARRRQWLVVGFVLLVGMALTAGSLIVRAVGRELAVARHQSDFVAAVSHEFRTPLTSLRQFTDMLREQPALDDRRRRIAYDAQARATDRLTRLVESLLDFGRMEAGARRYRFEPHDGSDLVRRVVDDFRAAPGGPGGHDITFRSLESAQVALDEEAMARAVRNLLENAVKYSPEPSPVEVAVGRRNGHLSISVRDHGMGIPAHERTKIFTKFHRGEQARTRGIKGTGIGLAMVDEIVRAHHCDSSSPPSCSTGSTFTILLPVLQDGGLEESQEVEFAGVDPSESGQPDEP